MADYGSVVADKAVNAVEKKIHSIYVQAAKELTEKLGSFLKKHKEKDKKKRELVEKGLMTEQEYKSWLKGQVFMEKQWRDKVDQATKVMNHANEEAVKVIESKKMNVFAENYNHAAYELESDIGFDMGFNLYNTESVARLIKDEPQILPKWKVDEKKDYIWNEKRVNRSITQGIIQGESVDDITKRLVKDLCSQNERKMRTFTRTAITGAQNAGRMEQMQDAVDSGIKMKKKWLATLDDRTRDTHRDLDGQIQEVDDPFESDLGEIMFPGDPHAEPGNVFNCRCTVIYVYEGIDQKSIRRDNEGNLVENMTYREWEAMKEGKQEEKGFTASEGQDMIYRGGAEPASLRYVNNQDDLYRNAAKIEPIDGYEDIVSHGDPVGFVFKDIDGNEREVSVADFVDMLSENPEYHGGDIRLIACESGADGSVVAQGIADRLGVNVMAPSDIVWVNEDGSMTIGKKPNQNTGEWRVFKPREEK